MAKRILVADDSVTIQKAFAMTFGAEDVTLASARSADEGLSVARQFQPDLVIADAVMPGRSGYDLCAALKGDRGLGDVPVYILVSAQNPLDEGQARQVGANGHFLKPFDSTVMIEKVHEALSKAELDTGVVSSSVGGRSNLSPPSIGGIPIPSPGSGYDEDEYGEITIDSAPVREAPRAAPTPVAAPSFAPPLHAPPPATAGMRGVPGMVPVSQPAGQAAPALGPGLRPSLIPGVRPGLTPGGRPGIVPPGGSSPAARPASAPAPAAMHAPAGTSPTIRPASVPSARTMVGMPVPRPGLSLPVPTPPARPGTGPLRTLAQPQAPSVPAPTAHAQAPQPPHAPASPSHAPSSHAPSSHAPSSHAPPSHAPSLHAPAPSSHAPVAGGPGLVEQKMAEIAARGPEYEVLAKLSREVIEKIVWEIVPELTEAIVREELQRRGRA